jgi:hypothetical protein
MTPMVKLLAATVAWCTVLLLGVLPAAAATDVTTRAACERIRKAQASPGIDVVKLQDATDQLARSSARGAKTIANQLGASLATVPPSPAFALRLALAWCDRLTPVITRPAAAPTTAPVVAPQHFEGTGNSEVTLVPGTVGAALARIAVQDARRFTVESFDVDGRPLGTVVDTTRPYTGTRPVNFEAGPSAVRLQVTTDGAWTIDIVGLDEAPRVSAPGHYDGEGDQVLIIGGNPTHARFRATATTGRFIVDGYGIFKAPLVDEPSPYTGTVVTPREANYVLEIQAEGEWSADLK